MQITRRVILIAISALVAACGSEQSGTIAAPDGETAEYRIDETTGETRMTITTQEGKATMRSGSSVPIELPKGFLLFPGSTVVSNTVVNKPDGLGTMVMFEAPANGTDIIAHFKRQAEAGGFAIELEATMNDTMMLSGKRASDGTSFLVNTFASEDGKTGGQLVIGNEKTK
jgi:hypothetical protein